MNLNRQQLSFLITIFSLAIVVLILYTIQLGGKQEAPEDYVVEMVLDPEIIEELLEKELESAPSNTEPIKSHLAFNETAKPTYNSPEPLKTLAEIMAEQEEMAENTEDPNGLLDEAYAERIKALAKKREEQKQLLEAKEAEKKEFTNNLADKKTSISYSLVGRNNYKLPPPIYTCIEGGKVVVNIEVNASGMVTDAHFNEKSSGTSNGCLVENAIAYAYKARFSSSTKDKQKGSITYLFQRK